ncbi:Histone-lysine N-methyltransferase KMT5B [Frankliniella fusca]|uniref:Histone-lysine N-methyltransferase KMT5B n=1 Tax=Frankliniella fusca TaxID=407009 RepID=A0AAE1H013_9NEOP|nr:Histone-lysine N-methyltransferase KMT5B [Frankliniella fusca]
MHEAVEAEQHLQHVYKAFKCFTSSLINTFYLTSKNTIVKTMKEAQYCIMETVVCWSVTAYCGYIKNILGLPHSLEMTLLNTIHQVVNISE